jgi:hypothetical protein
MVVCSRLSRGLAAATGMGRGRDGAVVATAVAAFELVIFDHSPPVPSTRRAAIHSHSRRLWAGLGVANSSHPRRWGSSYRFMSFERLFSRCH